MAKANWDLLSEDPEDIRRLIEQERQAQRGAALESRVGQTAPRTPVEETLARIFSATLSVPVGVEDDFFALGGSSLLATQVIARIRTEFRVDAPLDWILEAPTVERLAHTV